MPHILHIPIKAAGELPRALYRVLYANLLRWLAIVEPDVAQEVHDRPVRKPFTISGLEESPDRRTWTWRVTLMEDELLALVSEVAYRGDGLDLGRKHCDVQWPDSKVASVSYDDLASKAGDETYLRMAFVSATTFAAWTAITTRRREGKWSCRRATAMPGRTTGASISSPKAPVSIPTWAPISTGSP